ncbi:MAG: YetF domain-containing protein [Propionicimonas sp.]
MTDWLTPFVSMDISLVEKALRTVVVYLGIAILLRLAGKRLLAQMNSLDLVVVLLLSNVVQNAIIGPDNSVLGGLVGAVVLIGFDLGMDLLAQRSRFVRHLVVGRHTDVITNGIPEQAQLHRLGINDRELALALRRQGVDDPSQIEVASLEPEGDLLVKLKPGDRAVTRDDLAAAVAELKGMLGSPRA